MIGRSLRPNRDKQLQLQPADAAKSTPRVQMPNRADNISLYNSIIVVSISFRLSQDNITDGMPVSLGTCSALGNLGERQDLLHQE